MGNCSPTPTVRGWEAGGLAASDSPVKKAI